MRKCEICDCLAKIYCESDQASLCWDCDANVHSANFLVAKHSRNLLCHVCQSLTPWTGTGPKLGPTVSACDNCLSNNRDERGNIEDDSDNSDDDLVREDDSDEDEDDENSDSGNDGDEDEENQVVPWSCTPPPPMSSSSNNSTEECSSRWSDSDGGVCQSRRGFPLKQSHGTAG